MQWKTANLSQMFLRGRYTALCPKGDIERHDDRNDLDDQDPEDTIP